MTNPTKTPDPAAALATFLHDRAEGRATARRLAFDPASGELRLVSREPANMTQDPDAVVVDQIAESGFFAGATSCR